MRPGPHKGSCGSTAYMCVRGAPDCSHEFWEYLSNFDETENEEDALKLVAATLVVATLLTCTCLITCGAFALSEKWVEDFPSPHRSAPHRYQAL